jgi:acetyl esterase/lipase
MHLLHFRTTRLTFICWIFYISIVLLDSSALHAQPVCTGSGRYASAVFGCVDTLKNQTYGQGRVDWIWNNILCLDLRLPPYTQKQALRYDWYEPCQDTVTQRPLLLLVHGGAWAEGSKEGFSATADYYARKGFAVASINYRLSLPPNILCWNQDSDSIRLIRAAFRGVQDTKTAIRYFKAHASELRIHPDRIILMGGSAGAFNALGAAYMDDESERPPACGAQPQLGEWLGQLLYPDMGSIEGDTTNQAYSSDVHAVINVSGGIWRTDLFEGDARPNLLNIHGDADDVVPYGTDCLLPAVRSAGLFTHCIRSIGSGDLHPMATAAGVESELMTIPGAKHSFTAQQLMAITSRADFFVCEQLNPATRVSNVNQNPGMVTLFPNPASTQCTVRSSGEGRLVILDLNGKTVKEATVQESEKTLDLMDWSPGIYYWYFHGANTNSSGKMVIIR